VTTITDIYHLFTEGIASLAIKLELLVSKPDHNYVVFRLFDSYQESNRETRHYRPNPIKGLKVFIQPETIR
jgi:hypothetical protein